MKLESILKRSSPIAGIPNTDVRPRRIDPPSLPAVGADEDAIRPDGWGFADTSFGLDGGNLTVSGNRYPGLSGEVLSSLLPWFRRVIGVDFPVDEGQVETGAIGYPPPIPRSAASPAFIQALAGIFGAGQVTTDDTTRLRHGHGHTVAEMDAIRSSGFPRIPDCVVFPLEESQVSSLVVLAVEHGAVLSAYGGGTNVTEALRCLPEETRTIVSVDMSRMNRIEWIDPVDRMACIQAGATGRQIQAQLEQYGFTMGHEPDSFEFSTLGGWIATNASGMKKNRYGNIEDLVLDMTVVTTAGRLTRAHAVPRESIGIDPRQWMIGSEGMLGIITSAVVKLFPLPAERKYASLLFRSFEDGLAFMYDCAQEAQPPASVRLVDNLQFQFGQALKPRPRGVKRMRGDAERWLVTGPLGFDVEKMVAVTMVFEGTRREVADQQRRMHSLARRHRGLNGGAENGRRGYMLTFGIAYIRDFILHHGIVAESFETSVPWSRAGALIERVKSRILAAHRERGLPGNPFVSCRVTQVYETGCCVYFYMAFYGRGIDDAIGAYHEIENLARQEILDAGGSLSHHHGVGKLRMPFIPQIMSPASMEWRARMKSALDPDGVFPAQSELHRAESTGDVAG